MTFDELKKIVDEVAHETFDFNEHNEAQIYVDYDEEIDNETISKCLEEKYPMQYLEEYLWEWEANFKYDYAIQEIMSGVYYKLNEEYEDDDLVFFMDNKDMVYNYIECKYFWYYDIEDFNKDVQVNILLDTGNMNYDCTCDNSLNYLATGEIDKDSSLGWVARTQGKLTKLRKAVKDAYDSYSNGLKREINPNQFIESCVDEFENLPSQMATMTFMVNMSMLDLLKLQTAINEEKPLNDSYYLEERKGTKNIVLDKNVTCGLFEEWGGGGSLMEVTLEKDIKIPLKCIWHIQVEGAKSKYGYTVDEVYGFIGDIWKNCVKEMNI